MNKAVSYIRRFFILGLANVCIFASYYPVAYAENRIQLNDTLKAAIEKQSNSVEKKGIVQSANNNDFNWLDGVPSVSLSYLDSQQRMGTTERQLSLNLPIKAPFQKQIEKSLGSKVEALRVSAKNQYALYLSGLIRELLWSIKVEEVSSFIVARKQSILLELAQHYNEMAEVQAIPQYISLIVQKEVDDNKISILEHQQNIDNLLAKYHQLTGLMALPDSIEETIPPANQRSLQLHPDVVALDIAFQSAEQLLLSGSKKSSPWNIQLTGKRVEMQGFSENQLGLGIEVPITIGNQLSTVQKSEYAKAKTEYDIARSKLLQKLAEVRDSSTKEYTFLQRKRTLLLKGKNNLDALDLAMRELREANAPNQEFYIRTLLDMVDSQQAIELNRIRIQQHIALMRQSAGLTL